MNFPPKKNFSNFNKKKLPTASFLPQSKKQRDIRVDRLLLRSSSSYISILVLTTHPNIWSESVPSIYQSHILWPQGFSSLHTSCMITSQRNDFNRPTQIRDSAPFYADLPSLYSSLYHSWPSKTILDFQLGKWIVCFLPQNIYLLGGDNFAFLLI